MLCAQLGVFPFDSERGAIARARAKGAVVLRFFAALRMTILTRFFAVLGMTGKKVVGWDVVLRFFAALRMTIPLKRQYLNSAGASPRPTVKILLSAEIPFSENKKGGEQKIKKHQMENKKSIKRKIKKAASKTARHLCGGYFVFPSRAR